jgi:hypothetical protein
MSSDWQVPVYDLADTVEVSTPAQLRAIAIRVPPARLVLK